MSVVISNITKSFGAQKALDNVSLTAGEGCVMGLLGPNGAGKSTLMKIITGYLQPDCGDVAICGLNAATTPVKELHRLIGYLPEHNPLYTDMYVREYLTMAAEIAKVPDVKARVEEIIRLTGLTPEAHKIIGSLSKGYRQRVGIANALIGNPKVVILDEPTTGLDPNQIVEIRELIRNLSGSHTVIISTHIMQEVEAVCDEVAIIHHGRVVKAGMNIEELKHGNGMLVEVEFLNALTDDQIEALRSCLTREGDSEITVEKCESQSATYRVHAKQDARAGIFNFSVANNLTLIKLMPVQNTMEQVFRNLTN